MAFLCKTGAARKRVSICIPTEQDLVKKRLFGGKPALILDCLHIVNSLVAWSHAFVLRPFADGGRVELLPGFGSVTGLERGLLRYRSDLLNPKERPKVRAEFLARLEDFYTVRLGSFRQSGLYLHTLWSKFKSAGFPDHILLKLPVHMYKLLLCITANRTVRGQLGM